MRVDIQRGTIQIERIVGAIRPERIGRRIEYVAATTSTNDEAWRRAAAEDVDGLVILTDYQTAGRGRFGRRWESPRGASLLCSVLVIDESGELAGGQPGLLSAVAVRDAVMSCTDVVPTIRWPNDVLVGDRKLAGILVESRGRHGGGRAYVIGIGINCLQQDGHVPLELRGRATSLEMESRYGVDRTALAVALLRELDRWLASPACWDNDLLRDRWLAGAEPVGQRIRLRQSGKVYNGSIVDVDPQAALVVRLDEGGIRTFEATDTTVVDQETTAPT